MLTKSQVKASINTNALLNIANECLRFVTEFFEVISQSAPHIYHSALQLVPQSSIIKTLYSQQIYSLRARVVTGVPASWDMCTATVGPVDDYYFCPVWSPCGQFIAARFGDAVHIKDSDTLEVISTLRPPHHLLNLIPMFLTFSHSGHLLACSYCHR